MKPGARVAMLRKLRGLSQTELGRAVGLSQTAISLLESADRRMDADEVVRLARVLQCSLEDILGPVGSITITFGSAPPAQPTERGPGEEPAP